MRTPKDSRRLWYRRSSLPAMQSIAVVVELIRLKIAVADADDELLRDEFTRPAPKAAFNALCWFERRVNFWSRRRKLRNGSPPAAPRCGIRPGAASTIVGNGASPSDLNRYCDRVIDFVALAFGAG